MDKAQRIEKIQKFTRDPDWVLIERMIEEYIEPLRDIDTIDVTMDPGAVAAEVAGRQRAYAQMTRFLKDCRILGSRASVSNNSFK